MKRTKLKPNPKWIDAPYEIYYWFWYKPGTLKTIKRMMKIEKHRPNPVPVRGKH